MDNESQKQASDATTIPVPIEPTQTAYAQPPITGSFPTVEQSAAAPYVKPRMSTGKKIIIAIAIALGVCGFIVVGLFIFILVAFSSYGSNK